MYEMLKLGCAVVMIVMGLFMIAFPKLSTKKEKRDDPEAVAKIRKTGVLLTVIWVVILGLEFMMP